MRSVGDRPPPYLLMFRDTGHGEFIRAVKMKSKSLEGYQQWRSPIDSIAGFLLAFHIEI